MPRCHRYISAQPDDFRFLPRGSRRFCDPAVRQLACHCGSNL